MADKHQVIAEFKRVAAELGHVPSRREYLAFSGRAFGETAICTAFGSWSAMTAAAGHPDDIHAKPEPSAAPKMKMQKLVKDSLIIHELDLQEMFAKAGNPPSLKTLVIPDTHTEHADMPAFKCMLKFGEWYDPHVVLYLGDFLNASGLDHWEDATLDIKRFCPEVAQGRRLMDMVGEACPNVTTGIFCEGNHEFWLQLFMGQQKNPNFFDGLVDLGFDLSVKGLLQLERRGIQFFPMSEFVKIGRAHFVHGFYTGQNHPRKHLLKLKDNVYYGHLHDESGGSDSGLGGTIEAQSFGCLCDLRPKYLRGTANNWVHGFGTFEFFPDGTYCKVAHRIRNGKMSLAGRIFDGNDRPQE